MITSRTHTSWFGITETLNHEKDTFQKNIPRKRNSKVLFEGVVFLMLSIFSRSPKRGIIQSQLCHYVTTQKWIIYINTTMILELSVCNVYLFLLSNWNYRGIIFCFAFILEPVALANRLYTLAIYASAYTCFALLIVFRLFICKLGAITSKKQ